MKIRPLKWLAWLIALLIGAAVAAIAGLLLFTPNLDISSWPVLFNALSGRPGPAADVASVGQHLRVREGFTLTLYAGDIPKARWLRPTAAGDLLVSQPRLGQILLLRRDANGDGSPDAREILISGLDRPHGMDIADGWLYIGEGSAVGRVAFDVATGTLSGEYRHILEGVPEGGNHWSRTVRMGPDGWLYLNIGSSCNVCIEEHEWRAAMLRMRPDGSEVQLHATGLRNSVGFDWTPWSGELYATDNGRDLLGDDFPPCELNRVVAGGFYGWPFVNGDGVLDPDMGAGKESLLQHAISPVHAFRPHNAPLGITFLRDPALTQEYGRAALVALHGSWNRSKADGYKVVLLQWDESGDIRESDFMTGFEQNGTVIGRPTDVAEAGDGSLYVSDDYASAVYRITPGTAAGATRELAAAVTDSGMKTDPLAAVDAAEIASANEAGAALMRRFACASCHVANTPIGDKLATLGERYTLDALAAYFLAPTAPMPLFPLGQDERRTLAIHLLSSQSTASSR